MVNPGQVTDAQLLWTQPKAFSRFHQLTISGEPVASLRFERSSGSSAVAEFGQARWTLKRVGFLSTRVTVRDAGSEADVAVFTPSWTGAGTLQFASGSNYRLTPLNFWHTEWAFVDALDKPAVTLRGPHGMLKQGGETQVAEGYGGSPEAPVLLLLIWYLRLLMNEDAGVACVDSCASTQQRIWSQKSWISG